MIWTSFISADIKWTILTNIIKDKFYTEYRSSTHWHQKNPHLPVHYFCTHTPPNNTAICSTSFLHVDFMHHPDSQKPYRLGAIPSTQLTTFIVALQVRNGETVVGRSSRRVFLIGTLHIELPVGSCLLFEHKTIQIQLKTETSRDDVTQN